MPESKDIKHPFNVSGKHVWKKNPLDSKLPVFERIWTASKNYL